MTESDKPVKKRRWTIYGVCALFIILAFTLLLPGRGGPGRAAFKAEASEEANQVYIACQSYLTEYRTLPQTSENYRLIKILCGDNPRKMEFISLKPRQVSPNGEDIDPWGTPFRIIFSSGTNVDVISAGPDKIFGTPDDITNQ
jgi:hypothetical protein